MKFFKNLLAALIFTCLLCLVGQHLPFSQEAPLYARAAPVQPDKITTIIDDELGRPISAKTYNNILYLSLRDTARACGGAIKWYGVSGRVLLSVNNNQISFFLGTKNILINANKRTLPASIRTVRNDAFIPADFFTGKDFMETAGYNVSYDPDKNIMFFDTVMNVFSPRHYVDDGRTRVNIELAEKIHFRVAPKSKKEYEIVFYNARALPEKLEFDEGAIKQITVQNKYRVVEYRIRLARDDCIVDYKLKEKPLRLVFDVGTTGVAGETLTGATTAEFAITTDTRTAASSEFATATTTLTGATTAEFVATAVTRTAKIKIVLDPGHGGDDPGAVGPNGTKEKYINLAIAQDISYLLEEDGYEVILTRKDDTFIPLVDRTNMANTQGADLFISIHCNASLKKDSNGFEIYFLSELASDPEALATAALENSVVQLEKEKKKLDPKREKLQMLLWSMVVNEFINESSKLCSFITKEVTHNLKIENRGIKQAGFYVLRGAQMPAILVEAAFISNPAEEAKLRSRRFQKKIADAVYSGIKKYTRRYIE